MAAPAVLRRLQRLSAAERLEARLSGAVRKEPGRGEARQSEKKLHSPHCPLRCSYACPGRTAMTSESGRKALSHLGRQQQCLNKMAELRARLEAFPAPECLFKTLNPFIGFLRLFFAPQPLGGEQALFRAAQCAEASPRIPAPQAWAGRSRGCHGNAARPASMGRKQAVGPRLVMAGALLTLLGLLWGSQVGRGRPRGSGFVCLSSARCGEEVFYLFIHLFSPLSASCSRLSRFRAVR